MRTEVHPPKRGDPTKSGLCAASDTERERVLEAFDVVPAGSSEVTAPYALHCPRFGPDKAGSMQAGFSPDRSLHPSDSHRFESSRGRMHYVDEAAGPPIVLCHGNPTPRR